MFRACGLMTKACKAAGVPRRQMEAFMASPKGEEFKANYDDAVLAYSDVVRAEVHRRAIDGVDEEVNHQGQAVGTKRVYSDTLLVKMATAVLPEYNTKLDLTTNQPINIVVKAFAVESDLA